MRVKRFEATSMQEALRRVKHELGPQAVILSTRQIKKGHGTFGFFGRPMVEVTAAIDSEPASAPVPGSPRTSTATAAVSNEVQEMAAFVRALDPLQRDIDELKALLQQLAFRERLLPQMNLNGLEREFLAMKKMVELLVQQHQDHQSPLVAPPLMPWYQRLVASGMPEEVARHLVEKVQNSLPQDELHNAQEVQRHLTTTLLKVVPVCGALRRQHQTMAEVFVGPTGVGKTTTIAKLAAHYALGKKWKVALLTIDTYRIAAVEQLRTFAKIMNLPMDVVMTEAELDTALARHRDKDLVLIDTAGRSQRDALQMAELMAFFGQGKRARVHLVLSATASVYNLAETIARFHPLAPASLVFTKLDECNRFGPLLGMALQAHVPLSYLTTGQRVPEDIEVATAERVVDLILNVSQWCEPAAAMEEGKQP